MPDKNQFVGRWVNWTDFIRVEQRLFADGRFEATLFEEEKDKVWAEAKGIWEVVGNRIQWRYKSTRGFPLPRRVDTNKIVYVDENRFSVLERNGERTDLYRAIKLDETSVNFDLDQVQPFLRRIAGFISSGFGSIEISRFIKRVKKLKPDGSCPFVYPITFRGVACPFRIVVFMDDIDAPDLDFYAPVKLIREIEKEIRKLDTYVRG
jgi:hypothetical protein